MPGLNIINAVTNHNALIRSTSQCFDYLQQGEGRRLPFGVCISAAIAVKEVKNARAQIVDTRKTLPGLRLAQKYAVRTGGGGNHRLGLYDAVLIKENHIAAAGSVKAALQRALCMAEQASFIEIEVETLDQLQDALDAGAGMILLDNMSLAQMAAAVNINAGRATLEASGGVKLSAVQAIAATGVDRISIGSLTKNVRAIDFSMRFKPLTLNP